MLSCHKATRLMSESQERPLSQFEQLSLALHTVMCNGCRQFERQLPIIRSLAHRFAHRPETTATVQEPQDRVEKDGG
ncbi:zf-HC2 domain-containing protein [Oceanisphaera sp. IT1-181]|uniref:anti-sigma factor family protein n=1 Tax=Oceanisphaera sp. IT1-181 TaxID=3081199 RepID=UPI0029CA713F|nr:zf-HC2 domain-containing protein [Oceanisphaera sp. IT1-181]